jgi:hypothetical protein
MTKKATTHETVEVAQGQEQAEEQENPFTEYNNRKFQSYVKNELLMRFPMVLRIQIQGRNNSSLR